MSTFISLLKAVDRIQGSPALDEIGHSLNSNVPDTFTLKQLPKQLVDEPREKENSRSLIAILACLQNKERIQRESDDDSSLQRLYDYAASSIAPIAQGQDDSDNEAQSYDETAQRSRGVAVYGLEILHILARDFSAKFNHQALLTIVAFTNAAESWSTQETCHLAQTIFKEQLLQLDKEEFIVDTILKSYLRPLFSKSRPTTVTASGRKAEFPDQVDPHRGLTDETQEVKPWKYADLRAITVFSWAVESVDETQISKQWPLFIPVLLILLDDSTTRIRSRGLVILNAFLQKFPSNILRDTGLSTVFEQAIFPTLHFLPSITPEEESIQLLGPAYAALLTLAGKVNVAKDSKEKIKFLDKMLREGIFSAYFHAKEHVRIVEILVRETCKTVEEMGIHAVKHLKDLIPMYSEIMTNPFAAVAPSTLLAAIKSLQTTILNCWPRISQPAVQNELIKTLVLCWLLVQDDKDRLEKQSTTIPIELVKTAAMLRVAAKSSGMNLGEKVAPLIVKEPCLAGLFPHINQGTSSK